MRLLLINCVCGIRSTGRICAEIAQKYEAQGYEVKVAYGRMGEVSENCKRWAVKIGGKWSSRLHALMTRFLDLHGAGLSSYFSTKSFIKWAEEWKPDMVWLHNIHGYYLNYPLFFAWLKRHPEISVRWTLHDCWAFTGHCAYFTMANCELWVDGCHDCPCKHDYPASLFFSRAKQNWESKKKSFCGVGNLALVTPSKWLADLTRRSFMKEYPVEVVHNTIDVNIFKPTKSDFREKFGLRGKTIVLGVASVWDRRKGLDDFIGLRDLLDADFVIVLVGLSRRQIKALPKGVVGIIRTNSPRELAEVYTACDWFFNPTREENYPTVNLEARACGCRIVTYDTGGSAETVEGYDKAWVLKGGDKSPKGFLKVIGRQQASLEM